MTARLALLAALLLALPAQARPEDVVGWQGARWGMSVADLDGAVVGLERLAEPFQFSGAQAARSADTAVGGVPMLALFQTGTRTGRLQQVLLQTRRAATPVAHRRVAEALMETYGPPDMTCVQAKGDGLPLLVEQVWRFPTTTLHATLLDFTTTAVVTSDPNAPRDLIDRPDRRNSWRGFPRRIIIRYHQAARIDLWGKCGR